MKLEIKSRIDNFGFSCFSLISFFFLSFSFFVFFFRPLAVTLYGKRKEGVGRQDLDSVEIIANLLTGGEKGVRGGEESNGHETYITLG
jgi:hypothetical protein